MSSKKDIKTKDFSKKCKVLVPIDFTEITEVALEQAINLSKVIGAEVTLVNVIEDHGLFNKYISSKELEGIRNKLEKELQELAEKKSKESGISINYLIARGKIYSKINEVAEMLNATFIMMGTSGKLGLMKFIGSNTLRVIRESTIPVISILRGQATVGCHNIVLPLDLTKETRDKVAQAIWLAQLYKAKIHIVTVLTITERYYVKKAEIQMEQTAKFIRQKGIECTTSCINKKETEETIAQLIINFANKVKADVIMIMTQQEVNITRMFIGSSAQEIINNSNIPVMSIIPKSRKYQ